MAQILPCSSFGFRISPHRSPNPRWTILQENLKCRGRFSCLFADNNKQEQARKALESALGGKKDEFEKWNKEIQKREEVGGRGDAGGGGWFGWGRLFGWSNDDHFWNEAQQASLAVLGIVLVYLLIAKGQVMLAVVFNSLLYVLRGTRNTLAFMTARVSGKISPSESVPYQTVNSGEQARISAKESVVRKWGMD